MIALDTNVLVRCIVLDDAVQAAIGKRLLQHPGGFLLSKTVLLELESVLRAAYRVQRERIHAALMTLCGLPGAEVESALAVAQALADYAAGLDFADALHLASSPADEGFISFDAKLVRDGAALGRDVRLAGREFL